MLLNSLIFLLLSNSITSRRDKSILYSRVSISILLIAALITYDNLSFLFLAKGIGIFGGLFHVTATTNTFHAFIFLITSVILLLTAFYPRKVWLKHNSSPNRILFTNLIHIVISTLNIIRSIVVVFSLAFIPLWLEWSMLHFFFYSYITNLSSHNIARASV